MSKYTYDPNGTAYHLKGGKHTCPSCGKHTLQLYIGVENGEPINDQVGKCDRHYNCGYDYPPKAYYADHPEELPPSKYAKRRYYQQKPQKQLVTIPKEYVVNSIIPEVKNGLCGFLDILMQMFDSSDIQRVIDKYFLGYTKHGAVIFWQIDSKRLVREGKAMQYNVYTGGRDKASWATGDSFWIVSTLQARGIIQTPATSTKCIFGEHLLKEADATTNIMIVESEKNAIFGALAMPEYTWLAVGSSQDIGKIEKVKDILSRCRSVVVIPDSDALQDWREKVKAMNMNNVKVSNLCAGHAGGWDLADMIRDIYLQHPQQFRATQRREVVPMVEAPKKRCRIVDDTELFPEPYDYLAIYNNLQLPSDFFTERLEAVPF